MNTRNPEQMDERLANWIARLIATQSLLQNPYNLRAFFAWAAEEEVETPSDLTTLFEQWRDDPLRGL